ncbi:S8 family serine peptidase [Bacillus sp. F19]|nr:S8 family serine peptidase [Bacillus sp. F19]
MIKRKKQGHVTFSFILCALLLISTFLPNFALAKPNSKESISLQESSDGESKSAETKIDKKLNDQFNKNKTVSFLLEFKDQVDTNKVAIETAKKAKAQKQTAAKTELMKRSAIVSTLRAKANETQYSVKTYLEQEKKKGNVKEFESFYIVNGMAVTGTKQVMEKLATFPEVEEILPNEKVQLIPSESSNKSTQSIVNPLDSTEWNMAKIEAPPVWKMGIDGTGIVVASIDSGVQWNHPALKTKYRGYDPANPDQPDNTYNWFDAINGKAAPYDDHGHGTHTVGTMVGSEPNGTNQIGVAPGAKWIAVKAFTAQGATTDDLLAAGEWVLAPKDAQGNPHPEKAPDIVNNSWGSGPFIDDFYRQMVKNWRAAEIFPAFSAGNSGPADGSVGLPGNYPESFATGATDTKNQIADFSSRGPSAYGVMKPDISAPGVGIRSSIPGSNYGLMSGTSMASPALAGVVALIKQANKSLSVDAIEQILTETAIPLTDSRYPTSPNNGYGHGLVNAYNAVSSILTGIGGVQGQVVHEGQDTENPTYEHTAPKETYTNMVLPLTVQAQDNVSVKSVELQYRASETADWQTVMASRTTGNYKGGTYQAVIPAEAVQNSTLTYRWRITDYGAHEVTSDNYNVPVKTGISTGYFQDFESTPNGWISYGTQNSWEWGVPTAGPLKAASGEKVYGTKLNGHVDFNANMNLMMPPIILPEGNSYLQFKDWYQLEDKESKDFGNVFVSTDKQNWQHLSSFTGNSSTWTQHQIDLSAYAGKLIYIAFNVTTDDKFTTTGWYIDDVALSNTALTTANIDLEDVQLENSEAIKLTEIQDVMAPTATVTVTPTADKPMSLPLGATVSVLESGRSVVTNPADGSYVMSTHPAGEFTLRAESYGYYSSDQRVKIAPNGEAEANFTLKPLPQGTINGTITNKQTGQPIANATLSLIEDAIVQPVQTDENGRFSITAYEGDYTLHVSAPFYLNQDIRITVPANGNIEQNVSLQPFVGYPSEIGYDDGTAEAHRTWDAVNSGYAVKMFLPEGKTSALVTAGLFRFQDSSTSNIKPGGTAFQVAIYDNSGPGVNGSPGKIVAGPFDATAVQNGEWTVVDLSDKGIVVKDRFYMVYIQKNVSPNTPAISSDTSTTPARHSWIMYNGEFGPAPYENIMIRAQVKYEAMAPVITTPKDAAITNQSTFTVEGQASPATQVNLFNKGKKEATTTAREDGTFSVEVPLQNGENVLTATSSSDLGSTKPSDPVKITLDQAKPELTITKPADGFKTDQQTVTIEGKATDLHLSEVTINGQKANVTEDGSYSLDVLLNNGENKFTVAAKDRAGNETNKEVTVYAKFNPPAIENLKPDQNVVIKRGKTLTVELDSEPGISGFFSLSVPSAYASATAASVEIPLTEQGKGHYVGIWKAPKNTINGAVIEVVMRDAYGNESRRTAAGKVYVK